MQIGSKIKRLRLKRNLTQEELADRCELSKGFISQLKNDLTSPSIETLDDIVQALGTSLKQFFADDDEQIVFRAEDHFVKEYDDCTIRWLVTNSQKNEMEPILVTLSPGGETDDDMPHEGEEFGYVISGSVLLIIGDKEIDCKEGDSFYFTADKAHNIKNVSERDAVFIWVSSPPNF